MRALIQRVKEASVEAAGCDKVGINEGYLILLAVLDEDSEKDVSYLSSKTLNLRINPDSKGLLNRSILDTGGSILVISQFTLYADCRRGRRPSYERSAGRQKALDLYEAYVDELALSGLTVKKGYFGEDMDVFLINSGPVTIILDS